MTTRVLPASIIYSQQGRNRVLYSQCIAAVDDRCGSHANHLVPVRDQPTVRPTAKITVNIEVGIPNALRMIPEVEIDVRVKFLLDK